ncbi:TMC [Mytilus coruscus]|uniref:TMC n=1 Tax=Mytilus coruscus TaxID=42192 RepID=A0A6J8DPY5_MYTCO|nr:TMC [Mytilus coruscus]
MASIENNSDANVCTPLIGVNPENEPFQILEEEHQPGTMEPRDSGYGYNQEPYFGDYNNGHHRSGDSGNQVIPMEDYPRHNTSVMSYDHVPDGSFSQPHTLVVRNRKKSVKLEQIFDKLDQLDQLDGDDDSYFQRTKSKRRERSKTLRERKLERNASQKDSSLKATKTLGERYAEMKNNDDVTARNLATLMRQDHREDSTLRKMNKLRHGNGSKTWKNVKRSYNEFSHRISLWYSTFKEIEGEYGTAVMTYFKFLKWLLRLNLYTMLITFCVITIPFLVLGPSSYEDSVRSVNNSQDSIDCTAEYINYMDNFTSQESAGEMAIDFLQGTGWMERTILFYGVYYNKTYYSVVEKEEITYNMSLAYLLAVGCSFIICFILIVKNASKSAKVSLGLESSVAKYTNKVFAAWDYCINNQKNAKVKSVGIKFEITADLKEQTRTELWDLKKFGDRCAIYFKRVVINLLVIILLGGSLALIAYTAQQMIELQKKEYEDIVILIIQYVPYLTITILNLGVPIIFQKLVQFEMYKYETELKLTLARSVLLRLSSPIVLLAILYQQLIVTSKDSTSGKCGNVRWSATGSGLRGDVKGDSTVVNVVMIDGQPQGQDSGRCQSKLSFRGDSTVVNVVMIDGQPQGQDSGEMSKEDSTVVNVVMIDGQPQGQDSGEMSKEDSTVVNVVMIDGQPQGQDSGRCQSKFSFRGDSTVVNVVMIDGQPQGQDSGEMSKGDSTVVNVVMIDGQPQGQDSGEMSKEDSTVVNVVMIDGQPQGQDSGEMSKGDSTVVNVVMIDGQPQGQDSGEMSKWSATGSGLWGDVKVNFVAEEITQCRVENVAMIDDQAQGQDSGEMLKGDNTVENVAMIDDQPQGEITVENVAVIDDQPQGQDSGEMLKEDNAMCWETYVGQQVYKLVLLDLFVECGILFFGNVPRSIMYRKFKDKSKVIKMIGPQEFDLTQSVVDIVYSQNICWLGMMFSPLIPFMTFLKILIFFYSKKFLLKYCEAQERPYRTSRSNSLFMLVLLLSFVFAAAPIGYMVGRLQPSQSCGPFRLYSDANVVMFNTVSYTVASWPSVLRDLFSFLGTVGFFVPVIIALCLLMYYYWLLGQGFKKTEKILQHQLKMEGKDKQYLMERVAEFLESTEVNQNTLNNAGLQNVSAIITT